MLEIHIFPLDFDEKKEPLGGPRNDGIVSRKTFSVIWGPPGGPGGDRTFSFRARVPPRSGPKSQGGAKTPLPPLGRALGLFLEKLQKLPRLFGPISDPEAAIWTRFGAILDPYWTIWWDINVGWGRVS